MAMLGTSVFAQAKYPYLDTKLSYKERVENLLSLRLVPTGIALTTTIQSCSTCQWV